MEIIKRIAEKNADIYGARPVTIAFLGDSVTQGCFECYVENDDRIETVFESESGFAALTRNILHMFYPAAQINLVNSGISGDNARNGNDRFERDIAPFSPDLVVVGYGLNDCTKGEKGIAPYTEALASIFEKTKGIGAECIFLTPNLMNDVVSPHLKEEKLRALAKIFAENILDRYVAAAKKTAKAHRIPICDVYAKWCRLRECGVNTTELLSNKLNHPTREMHRLTAYSLVETMFG